MKFLHYAAAALATVALASCSSDEPAVQGNANDGRVTYSVKLPGDLASRTFSDGYTAINLVAVAYDHATGDYVDQAKVNFPANSLETDVTLQLVTGRTYDITFWAQKNGVAGYTFDATNHNLSIDYSLVEANNDDYDAFFFCDKARTITAGQVLPTIYMRRPFAQLNVGTDDLSNPSVLKAYGADLSGLTTKIDTKAYSSMDMISGIASNLVSVSKAGIKPLPTVPGSNPAVEEAFPTVEQGKTYQYLAMMYLLQDTVSDQQLTTLTFPDNVISIPSVPYQRNYQTNIYGSLLTTQANYHVVKVPIYDGSYNLKYPFIINTAADFDRWLMFANGNPDNEYTFTFNTDVLEPDSVRAFKAKKIKLVLNGHKLETKYLMQANTSVEIPGAAPKIIEPALEVDGGTLQSHNPSYGIAMYANGAKLILNNATFDAKTPTSSAILMFRDKKNMELTLNDCTIKGQYAIGVWTQSGSQLTGGMVSPGEPVKVTINGCDINTTETPVCMITTGELSVKDSKLTGGTQCVINRNSNGVIENSELILNANEMPADNRMSSYITGNLNPFGGGNNVAYGALILGDRNGGTSWVYYRGNVNFQLINTSIKVQGPHAAELASVYAVSHFDQACNVTYDAQSSVFSGKGFFYYHSLWGTPDNQPIIINGTTTTVQGGQWQ